MTRIVLLGIVAIAVFIIAPQVGASRTVKINPHPTAANPQPTSPLIARTVFDADLDDVEPEDVADRRGENVEDGKVEERRDDARDWAED